MRQRLPLPLPILIVENVGGMGRNNAKEIFVAKPYRKLFLGRLREELH
jgi:hypothetical protein